MTIYSRLLPEDLLKQLLENLGRRFILVQLLIECFLRLPTSAALPKWVIYSQETLALYCNNIVLVNDLNGLRLLDEAETIEQKSAQK